MASEIRGNVKWYVDSKGFGLIVAEDRTEYFVRQENIEVEGYKRLEKGSTVIFDVGRDADGKLEATNVRPDPEAIEFSESDTRRNLQ